MPHMVWQVQREHVAPGATVPFTYKLGMGCISGGVGSFVGNPASLMLTGDQYVCNPLSDAYACCLAESRSQGVPPRAAAAGRTNKQCAAAAGLTNKQRACTYVYSYVCYCTNDAG